MKAAKSFLSAFVVLLAWGATPLWANDDAMGSRVKQLESETQALRAELQWMRDHPVNLPPVEATPISMADPAKAAPAAPVEDTYTFEQVESMMVTTAKKYAWTKGDFTITPYGSLWGNMVYETERTAASTRSYPTYVYSPTAQGEDVFDVDGKNTRLGIDVTGPRLWPFHCATSGGKVEFDFQGGFDSTENRGGILLRHAYVEVKNDDYRLLLGQTWDVVSPLNPTTTMYSVYWNWGNIGYRRAQLRYERYWDLSDVDLLTWQISANQNIISDFRTDANLVPEPASWPLIETRVAWTFGPRGKDCKPIVIGFSGHGGEQGFDRVTAPLMNDVRRRTWSVNADFDVPLTHRLGVKGEFYSGENLSTFLGGIAQGIDPTTLESIRVNGGWVELYYYLRPNLHTHFAYGLDDPVDQDVTNGRIYNQFYFGNLMYDVTKQFCLGVEVGSLKTLYTAARPGDAVRLELMAKYSF